MMRFFLFYSLLLVVINDGITNVFELQQSFYSRTTSISFEKVIMIVGCLVGEVNLLGSKVMATKSPNYPNYFVNVLTILLNLYLFYYLTLNK